ncbi:TrmH family RNA methyltransferase [Pleomorphomonas carboxyditropha]|uniref:RNA methyltransferase n=1 Tax=Pleomorphomonas carboxyditropha TaxID=2023338 RepID=A0A2G9WWM1_9HYPH|nr:RNA methyltransferase [Pleomorphomonas carboxyditropha]PIO99079.1 RNA methyltransferase [Pleomorphomonas carboxyditropha]
MLIPVTDPADPRLMPFMNVRDRDLRQTHGDAFVAEGESVLAVFLSRRSRFRPEALLIAANRIDATLALSPPDDLPVFVADQGVMDAIVGFPIHRGLLGLGRRFPSPPLADLLADRRRVVVGLVGIANHDNMGGIFRNAAAFGAGAMVLDATSCDPLYRKAIRVSVGGALTVPFTRLEARANVAATLAASGYRVLALSPRGAMRLDEVPADRPVALLLGTEGPGLPAAEMAGAETVRIDMAGGFDSLNVATTSGIALYELTRRMAASS